MGRPYTYPAPNKNENSSYLYVGARLGGIRNYDQLTNISGRISQHLGYYRVETTQALHMLSWASGLDYQMELSIMPLDQKGSKWRMDIVEKIVASVLRPLCGKH